MTCPHFDPENPRRQTLIFDSYQLAEREEMRAWERHRRTTMDVNPIQHRYRLVVDPEVKK